MAEEAVTQETKKPEAAARKRRFGVSLALVNALLTFLGETAQLSGQTLAEIVRSGVDVRDLLAQMAEVGVDSIWIVLIITTATGAVFALYTAIQANQIGFTQFVGGALAYT